MKSILSVGMDVHKNSFSLCAYDGYTGEIVSESTFASDVPVFRGLHHECLEAILRKS